MSVAPSALPERDKRYLKELLETLAPAWPRIVTMNLEGLDEDLLLIRDHISSVVTGLQGLVGKMNRR